MLVRASLITLVSALVFGGAFANEPGYEYTIPRTTTPPQIDGKLDMGFEIWSKFDPVQVKMAGDNEIPPEYVADAWAAYDDENIYVAFLNRDPDPGEIKVGQQDPVTQDDTNEIFIEPANQGVLPYSNLMVTAGNEVRETDLVAVTAAAITEDGWTMEAAISFKGLGENPPQVGDAWGWNFNRHVASGIDKWVSWTPIADWRTVARFGDLIFGTEKVSPVEPAGKLATLWGLVRQ